MHWVSRYEAITNKVNCATYTHFDAALKQVCDSSGSIVSEGTLLRRWFPKTRDS
jgi:hypothetical protein